MMRLKSAAFTMAVVAALSFSSAPLRAADDDKPIRALLVIGGGYHDYKAQKDIITKGISARANVQWTIAYDPNTRDEHLNLIYEKEDRYKGYDVIVHDECSAKVTDLKIIDRILKPHREGLPAVLLHCGLHCYRSEGFPKNTPWFEFTGLMTTGHGPQEPIAIAFTDKESPITKGMEDWTTVKEELYNNITGKVAETAQPLARGKQTYMNKGKEVVAETIVVWTNTYNGKAKVFATTLGHNNKTVEDARFLDMVTRGLLWSVGKLDEKHLKPAKQVLLGEPMPK